MADIEKEFSEFEKAQAEREAEANDLSAFQEFQAALEATDEGVSAFEDWKPLQPDALGVDARGDEIFPAAEPPDDPFPAAEIPEPVVPRNELPTSPDAPPLSPVQAIDGTPQADAVPPQGQQGFLPADDANAPGADEQKGMTQDQAREILRALEGILRGVEELAEHRRETPEAIERLAEAMEDVGTLA